MLDQNAFSESPELMECLNELPKIEEGCYKVSSLAEVAYVLRKFQAEKIRQIDKAKRKAQKEQEERGSE